MSKFIIKPNGFHLIEMLIVLAMVSLLTLIALPSYQQHFRRAYRLQAMTALSQLALQMEKYYLVNESYAGASFDSLHFSANVSHAYQLQIASEAYHYLLRALPIGKQRHDACGTLTLNDEQEKGAKRSSCW